MDWAIRCSEDPSGENWKAEWRLGGEEDARVGAPGQEQRIQTETKANEGHLLDSFPVAVAGVKGRSLAPVEKGQQLTPPGKKRLFIDWAAYHNAQGSRAHALPLNCLYVRSWPTREYLLRRLQQGRASMSTRMR